MKPGMKMLMVAQNRNNKDNRGNDHKRYEGREGYDDAERSNSPTNIGYYRTEMNGYEGDWEADSRFRDRHGREHYDNGRFAPMRNEIDEPDDNYDFESRRYRRRDNGRFAPRNEMRMNYESEGRSSYGGESHYPFDPIPAVYEKESSRMNQIGFALNSNQEIGGGYRSDSAYSHVDEMTHRTSPLIHGRASGGNMELTREMAEEWMAGLKNEDGTKGPHWTLEQVKQVMAQRGVECDPLKLWVAMNAEYSDRVAVNKKHNVNTIDFYLDSAIAYWLKDKDAVGDKEAAYFMHVVKH